MRKRTLTGLIGAGGRGDLGTAGTIATGGGLAFGWGVVLLVVVLACLKIWK